MTTAASKPRRRWHQFGLGTLLWLMLLIALLVFGANEHQQRLQLAEENARLKAADELRIRGERIKAQREATMQIWDAPPVRRAMRGGSFQPDVVDP